MRKQMSRESIILSTKADLGSRSDFSLLNCCVKQLHIICFLVECGARCLLKCLNYG